VAGDQPSRNMYKKKKKKKKSTLKKVHKFINEIKIKHKGIKLMAN
jgi:hypothetical protein